MKLKTLLLVTPLLLLFNTTTFSQELCKALISIDNCNFISGIENYFKVVAQQEKEIGLNQIKAVFKSYDSSDEIEIEIRESSSNYFIINPNSLGMIKIEISLEDAVEYKWFHIKPLKAVGRLSKYTANHETKISAGEFKAQKGITANVECCGYDARLKVISYELIRIGSSGTVERGFNGGGKFKRKVKSIISRASSGDLFIFRKIYYKSLRSEEIQRLEDMTFEIK